MGTKNVIIVTSSNEFGAVVGNSLQNQMSCGVFQANSLDSVAIYLENLDSLNYALVDLDLGFSSVKNFVSIIRDRYPSVELILISRTDLPKEAEELHPWKMLSKPFIESDLLDLFQDTKDRPCNVVINGKCVDVSESTIAQWAKHREKIFDILVKSMSTTDAYEAVLIINGQVLAYAGNVNKDDRESCAKIAHQYLSKEKTGEIIKYICVNSNNYLLHSTILVVGIILAMLYDPEKSFTTVRQKSRLMCNNLVITNLFSDTAESYKGSIVSGNTEPIKRTPPPNKQKPEISGEKEGVISDQEKNSFKVGTEIKENPPTNKSFHMRRLHFNPPLSYSFILVPRFESHLLINDLANFLGKQIPILFRANGWGLESLYIDKRYLNWIALLPPTVAPTAHLRIIRKDSSKLILQNFTRIDREGILTDFWAPGYLLEPGRDRIPESEINDFIKEYRQGLYQNEEGQPGFFNSYAFNG